MKLHLKGLEFVAAMWCVSDAYAYEYVPLDPPGLLYEYPYLRMNDFREVLLGTNLGSFVWRPLPLHGLPAGYTTVDPVPGSNYFGVDAINNRGQVVGYHSTGIAIWLPEPAFGLPAGTNKLPFYSTNAYDWHMNNNGEVITSFDYDVHSVWLPSPAYGRPAGMVGVRIQNGLGYPATISQINDNGLVTGDFNDGKLSVSLLQNLPGYSGTGLISMFNPPVLGSTLASNNKNQLLARLKAAGNSFRYSLYLPVADGEFDAGWHDLYTGTESFLLTDINDRGEVLGFRTSSGPFVWSLNKGFQYLNTNVVLPGDTTSVVYQDINNNGDIVGYRRTTTGVRTFMLTIPEPTSLAIPVLCVAITRRARRCRHTN